MASSERALRVGWFSYFPVEWLPDPPEVVARLPKLHPATWQRVLIEEFLQRSDLELHVISLRKELPRDVTFRWQGVTFHCLRIPKGWRAPTLFWLDTWLIRRKLRAIRPDLVHAWGTENAAALVASRLRYPFLVTIQGLLAWYAQRIPMNRYERLVTRLEPISLRRSRFATTESSFSKRYLQEHYPNLEVIQAEHASNWIFHRLKRRPETKPVRLLYVGMLDHRKGTDLLIRALDALSRDLDFVLALVGSSSNYFTQLQESATPALRQRVVLRSNLDPYEVAEEMARATVLIHPTRADTSPNSVKEAVVAGVPVVASALGGIVDYVVPGKNGYTFEPGSWPALEQAIRNALAHPRFILGEVDPDTLSQMREYLSPRVMADKFYSAYKRVLASSGEAVLRAGA